MLGVAVDKSHPEGEETAVAAAALAAPHPVLIAWHHSLIPVLARAIAGHDLPCPGEWPEERFDLVWVLDRDAAGGWRFSLVPQQLFAEDISDPM